MLLKKRGNESDGASKCWIVNFFREVSRMRISKWQAMQVCEVNSLQSKKEKANGQCGETTENQEVCSTRERRRIKSIPKRISQFAIKPGDAPV